MTYPLSSLVAVIAGLGLLAPAEVGAGVAPKDLQRVVCTVTPIAPIRTAAVVLSRDGRRVAMRSEADPLGGNDDGSEEIFLWDDAAGLRQLTDTPRFQGLVAGPEISAEGNRVVFGWNGDPLGTNGDGGMEVFVWDEETGISQVTDTPEGFVARVGISPDGRRLVFEADFDPLGTNAGRNFQLFVWGPEPGLVQVTDHETTFERVTSWAISDDGGRIAFENNPGGLVHRISLWDEAAGSMPIAASDSLSSFGPSISADGGRVAFTSAADLTGENPDGGHEIFLWDDGAGIVQITATTLAAALSPPSLDAAGSRLAFSSQADLVGENPDGGQEVFLWREDQGLEQITDWRGRALPSFAPRLSANGFWITFTSQADLVGLNPVHLAKVFLWGEGFGMTQVSATTLDMSFVTGISGNGGRVAFVTRPFPQLPDPDEGFEVAVADCGEPAPPAGPWLESPAVPGFRFQVRLVEEDGSFRPGAVVADCIPETLCVSGAVPGRAEVFLRVIGPRPNGELWPVLAKFSTATMYVWIEQTARSLYQFYVLPGAQPRVDVLAGLVDRHGFPPAPGSGSGGPLSGRGTSLAWAPSPPGPLAFATAGEIPEPPSGPFLATPELPGFRFKVRITPRGGVPQPVRRETSCTAETLCVSGALPGRSELFVRIVGPKPNGRLWPNLVRLTPSEIEVWIEQDATGDVRYYRLRSLSPTGAEIPGLFDRVGFTP